MGQEAYRVEVEDGGCDRCGAGKYYCIVGPDGVALGTSYELQTDADDICELLNDAYELGLQGKVVA